MRKIMLYSGGVIALGLAVMGICLALPMLPALIALEWGCRL